MRSGLQGEGNLSASGEFSPVHFGLWFAGYSTLPVDDLAMIGLLTHAQEQVSSCHQWPASRQAIRASRSSQRQAQSPAEKC